MAELKDEHFLKQTKKTEFISRLAYYFAELNSLHPFREGNGRATREFIRQQLYVNGYSVDWSAVAPDKILDVMVASVFDTAPLIAVLALCISPKP